MSTLNSSATPTLSLTFAQIMSLQYSPGIQTIRLGPMDTNRNFLIDTELVVTTGSPPPFHPLSKKKAQLAGKKFSELKSLHLAKINYNYIPIFQRMGPIPTLEELTVELATPSRELYPMQQSPPYHHPTNTTQIIPFWYSHQIAQGIHALVGEGSNVKSITLQGFHAYKSTPLDSSENGSDYDLLAHLLDPTYFPHLEHLHLSGFSPSSTSAFWSTIQLNEAEGVTQRKLPIRSLTFAMKTCREDLVPSTLHADTIDGVEAVSKLFRAPSSYFNRPLRASIHLEDDSYYTLFNACDHVDLFTGQNFVTKTDGGQPR